MGANYADEKPVAEKEKCVGEKFAAENSIGKSLWLKNVYLSR